MLINMKFFTTKWNNTFKKTKDENENKKILKLNYIIKKFKQQKDFSESFYFQYNTNAYSTKWKNIH